jgi:hypothetical protein
MICNQHENNKKRPQLESVSIFHFNNFLDGFQYRSEFTLFGRCWRNFHYMPESGNLTKRVMCELAAILSCRKALG